MTPKTKFFVVASAFVFTTGASAQSVTLGASSSNTLIQVASSAGSAQLSNGQGDIFVGRTNQDGQGLATISIRRGLVAFDVADNVPARATITGVTLAMQDEKGMNGDQTISLSRMLRSWGQGTSYFQGGIGAPATNNDATWYYTFYNASIPAASPAWTMPGGDFSATVSAQALDSAGGSSTVVWSSTPSPAMVTDVQAWLDSPAANFGWIMLGNESAGQTAKRFGGQTAAIYGETPPALTVQYNTVPWTWTGGAGNAEWSSSGNWSAGSGSLSGNISVVLGSSAESGGTVDLLSTSADVSQLTFASAQPAMLMSTAPRGGRLTLDNGSSTIEVAVSSSGDAINAGVTVSLNSDTVVTTTASSDSLTVAGDISDGATAHGIEKDGPGTLVLSGSNTYTGGTIVDDGRLVVDSRAAIVDGSNLTVGAEGVLFFGASAPLTRTSAVPEPGTLAIVASGAVAAVVAQRLRTLRGVRSK